MSKWRNRWLTILTILTGCMIGCILMESTVRLFHLYSFDTFIAPHPHYGVMNIPGVSGWYVRGEVRQFVSINNLGLRDSEYRHEGSSHKKTVLLLGDSFIAGFQVPLSKTCQAVAESILAHAHNEPIEIIPGACNGWGTKNQLEYLMREGFAFEPDMIVLALYPDNDLMDNLVPDPVSVPWPPPKRQHFRLLTPSFIRAKLGTNLFVRSFLRKNDRIFRAIHPTLHRAEKAIARGLLHIYSETPTPMQTRMWNTLSLYLRMLRNSVEDHGAKFAVMVIPGTLAFNPPAVEELCDEHPLLRDSRLDPIHPRNILADSLRISNIRFIDILPVFRRYGTKTSDLFFPAEGHWNETGNRIAGEYLARLIADELIMKRRPIPVATSDSSCVRSSISGFLQ